VIVNYEDLPQIREDYPDKTVVFTGGVFDLVHEGHVSGMQYCKSKGDLLVVGVSSDERVRQRKGLGRPVRKELGRLILVDALKPVDYAFIMPTSNNVDSPTIQVIKTLRPNIFMDHEENKQRWINSMSTIQDLGTELIFNISYRTDSSTSIIERILKSNQEV
jgi:D-beta-D-heptose 7-phosphate kinase/D-beta-D-heptose 1-phosphate adenosyltransferase